MTEPRAIFEPIIAASLAEARRRGWLGDAERLTLAFRIALYVAARGLLDDGGRLRRVESFRRVVRRNSEDILTVAGRLTAPDVRARGAAIAWERLGGGAERALEMIGALAGVDRSRAEDFLAMTTAGVVSALAKLRREAKLNTRELKLALRAAATASEKAYPTLSGTLWRGVREERDRGLFGRVMQKLLPASAAPELDAARGAAPANGKSLADLRLLTASARIQETAAERPADAAPETPLIATRRRISAEAVRNKARELKRAAIARREPASSRPEFGKVFEAMRPRKSITAYL